MPLMFPNSEKSWKHKANSKTALRFLQQYQHDDFYGATVALKSRSHQRWCLLVCENGLMNVMHSIIILKLGPKRPHFKTRSDLDWAKPNYISNIYNIRNLKTLCARMNRNYMLRHFSEIENFHNLTCNATSFRFWTTSLLCLTRFVSYRMYNISSWRDNVSELTLFSEILCL